MTSIARVFPAFVAALTMGCGHRHEPAPAPVDDDALADDAEDLSESTSQSTTLGKLYFVGLGGSQSDPTAAVDAVKMVADLGGGFTRKCVSVTPMGAATVAVHYDGCAGPYHLDDVEGSLTATFTRETGQLVLQIANVDLAIDHNPVKAFSVSAQIADLAPGATERLITWSSQWEVVNRRGVLVTHTATLDLHVDAARCVVEDGTVDGALDGRGIHTVIEHLGFCPKSCPIGTISTTGKASHRTVTLVFDGSSTSKLIEPSGASLELPLLCE